MMMCIGSAWNNANRVARHTIRWFVKFPWKNSRMQKWHKICMKPEGDVTTAGDVGDGNSGGNDGHNECVHKHKSIDCFELAIKRRLKITFFS